MALTIDTTEKVFEVYKTTLGESADEVIVGKENVVFAEILPDQTIKEYVEPTVEFTKWNKEENLTLSYPTDIGFSNKTLVDGELKLSAGKEEFYFRQHDLDTMKFGLILNEIPDKSKIVAIDGVEYYQWQFKLVGWENFDFFYQDTLENDYKNFGYQQGITLEEYLVHHNRPEEVVGSYAVYHKSKINNQYAAGKFGHISKPRLLNAKNEFIGYPILKIEKGEYKLFVPINILNNAEYPVRFNDQFGLNTVGGSYLHDYDIFIAVKYPNAPAGQITKAYIASYSVGTNHAKMALYSDVSGTCTSLIANTYSGVITWSTAQTPTTLDTWASADIANGFTLVAGTTYWIAWSIDSANYYYYYDTGAAATEGYNNASNYAAFPPATAPSLTAGYQYKFSMCYEYTPSGGGSPSTPYGYMTTGKYW